MKDAHYIEMDVHFGNDLGGGSGFEPHGIAPRIERYASVDGGTTLRLRVD
jgi:hypothetical protein